MSPELVAWVAGVIESLGRIRLRELDNGTQLAEVSISSPNIALLERVAELTGTRVVVVKRDYKRVGCSEHCGEQHLHVRSITGRWQVTGVRATMLLAAILPSMSTLRNEAQEALEIGMTAPRKAATVAKMRELGWPDVLS